MTLKARHFPSHLELTAFINAGPIARADILKIDADTASGGWVIWWWVA